MIGNERIDLNPEFQQVAWMKRSGIQESSILDYATLHPGYARC